ncbi:DBP4 [Candida oxycetoniae]|uniref:ATP-dependent RNA helicase n=1 Tax=Candida oxycetoniae TaxID=497107 RepID=A0AAI9SU64_9ASCO|nr:DBP4 [Candida oxycetoniae]KAI3402749.2 DBP4 [Candida oxycetoniae]
MVSAVILVQHATPETIIQFQDQLSNELPAQKGKWNFTFKVFRNNSYSVPEELSATHIQDPNVKFLFTLTPSYLPGSTMTVINGKSAGVFCNSIREEVLELGNTTELCIPDAHMYLGATTGLNENFDIFVNQKLQSLWTQKQIIKGDGGQIYELENGNLVIRTSNVFMHGSFKGLLVQIEVSDKIAEFQKLRPQKVIETVLKKYNIPSGKLCCDVLDSSYSDRNGKKALKHEGRKEKRRNEEEEQKILKERVEKYCPDTDENSLNQFKDLPITQNTLRGLNESSFVSLTDIQKKTIPIALKGEDLMGTARTGSGKTLAFLIPVIEILHRNDITEFDGLAALIVSPTRELAVQIFEVLAKIGKYNSFSAGLVTGGKDVQYEKERISRMNILVGTPGRISQHLNESVGMETANLQVLVLDEADRCLDMGFRKQIDNILTHLPPTRQTLLFSATQSDSVQDLARLSLTNPKRINNSSDSDISAVPESLDQYYIKVPLHEKLDVLWSFIKSHLKSKILVFFSSSKQVQYAYETFRTLQPGISLMKLYGRHKQTSRLETTVKFSKAQHACLFATDIVARGLDFPAIDWVVQVDCPEDVATYVHRVGRSARFGREGKSLLMLLPSEEEGMLKRMKSHHIEPKLMTIKQKSKKSIKPQLQSLCFKDPVIKNLGQRAFIAYFRSIYIQPNKDVFKVEDLPVEEYAASLGLPGAPRIKIKGGEKNKEKKNQSRKLLQLAKLDINGEEDESQKQPPKVRTKYDRMFERKNQTILSDHYLNMTNSRADSNGKGKGGEKEEEEEGEDFLTVKRQDHDLNEAELPDLSLPVSKRQAKKALSRKASSVSKGNPTKFKFDDDGVPHAIYELEDEEDFIQAGDAKQQKQEYVLKEQEAMKIHDLADKETERQKRQEKKRKRKEIEKRLLANEQFESNNMGDEDADEYEVPDLERDMEPNLQDKSSGKKNSNWFNDDEDVPPKKKSKSNSESKFVEYNEPETLEDLESLAATLIGN